MILDALLKLSAAQAVTADAVSTNTIDSLAAGLNWATGEPMAIVIAIKLKGTNTGSAKLTAIQSAAANLGSPQIIGEIDIATADIALGNIFIIPLSQGIPSLRYLGINYDITGTVDFTVDAYLQPLAMASKQQPTIYPKGYLIS